MDQPKRSSRQGRANTMGSLVFCSSSPTLVTHALRRSREGRGGASVCRCTRRPLVGMTLRPEEDGSSNETSERDRKAVEGEFAELDHVSLVDKDMERLRGRLEPYREYLKRLNKQMHREIEIEEELIEWNRAAAMMEQHMAEMRRELKELSALTGIDVVDPETGKFTYGAFLLVFLGIGIPIYLIYLSVQILRSLSVAFGHMF